MPDAPFSALHGGVLTEASSVAGFLTVTMERGDHRVRRVDSAGMLAEGSAARLARMLAEMHREVLARDCW